MADRAAASPAAAAGVAGSRAGKAAGGRSNRVLATLLTAPVVIVIVVVAVYVYLSSGSSTPSRLAAPVSPAANPSSAAPSLGPWKHIDSRVDDPQPLTLAELFPARFGTAGSGGVRTVQRATSSCTRAVIGAGLRSAVRSARCSQVMRASYLSSDRKIMATIGVVNLATTAGAERVGKASGTSEFIRQLPGPRGPTKKLAQGTGLEEAAVKGHYLIMTFVEFASLHTPSGKRQKSELAAFSGELINDTVNTSLSSRMVTGQPTIVP